MLINQVTIAIQLNLFSFFYKNKNTRISYLVPIPTCMLCMQVWTYIAKKFFGPFFKIFESLWFLPMTHYLKVTLGQKELHNCVNVLITVIIICNVFYLFISYIIKDSFVNIHPFTGQYYYYYLLLILLFFRLIYLPSSDLLSVGKEELPGR